MRGPLALGIAAVLAAIGAGIVLGLPAGGVVALAVGMSAVVGLAGHRTLGNLAAGAAMRLARPYCPGEQVRLYLPGQHRVTEAEIVRIGSANTALMTPEGLVVVPNTQMLRPASTAA